MSSSKAMALCTRCGQNRRPGARWPDGLICNACHRAAGRRLGRCAACGQHRVLPGQRDGDLLCARCAGISGYECATCGALAEKMWGKRECERCALRRRLTLVLDDGTGRVAGCLIPVIDALCEAPNPSSGEGWLASQPVRDRIQAIARGELALTHDAFSDLPPSRGVEHLRDLLITLRLLPPLDRDILRFEQWSARLLASVDQPDDRRIIARYVAWHHHRRLATKARSGELRPSSVGVAHHQVRAAVTFLGWLRRRGVPLDACGQADIDAWFAAGPPTRSHARRFISWAGEHRLAPRLRLPRHQQSSPNRLSHPERIVLIERLLADQRLSLVNRVAGLIVVLYAQPVARVTRLRLDAVAFAGDEVRLLIANEKVPLPEPVGRLLVELTASRPNMSTAANAASPWLFPGRHAGQPMTPKQLRRRLKAIGVDRLARVAALDDLAGEIPAPVLAELTGYNPRVIANRASKLATDWTGYASLRTRAGAGSSR